MLALPMVRFAAVAAEFGNMGTPGAGSRVPTSHRKRTARYRQGYDIPPVARGLGSRPASELNRRRFLGALAAATVAGVGAARLVVDPHPRTFAETPPANVPTSGPTAP